MKIAERAVDYPRLVLVGALVLTGLGIYGVATLPVERRPRVEIPLITVSVPNVGASPATNESEITRKIEELAGTLEDVDYVTSLSRSGSASVSFVFLDKADIQEAKRDVQNLVDQVRSEFPKDAREPRVNDVSLSESPVIWIMLSGQHDMRVLRDVAEGIQDRLEGIEGVAGADVYGGHQREVQVQVNPHLLTIYGLTYEDVARAVSTANAEAPTGSIDFESGRELRVRFQGKYPDVAAIRRTPLVTRQGQTIVLGDVADVVDHHKRITSYTDTTAGPAVAIQVRSKVDINTLETIAAVKAVIEEERVRLGDAFHLGWTGDQGRDIRLMLRQLGSTAGIGLVLVVLILTMAMGFRNGLMVAFAMPFSLLAAAGLMVVAKETVDENLAINNMVMYSLILVVGMVVDGALIVGENIYRHLEEGRTNVEAAKIGIREVGPAVIAADLTTIAAFVPMLLVSGMMGQFLRVMPITVAFALGASVLVDHFVLPVMSRYGMRIRRGFWGRGEEAARRQETIRDPAQDTRPLQVLYMQVLRYCLHHRWLVLVGSCGGVAMSAGVFLFGVIGFEFMPKSDLPYITISYELPLGSRPERTREVGQTLLASMRDLTNGDEMYGDPVVVVGSSGGRRGGSGPEYGHIDLELVDSSDRDRSADEIERYLQRQLPNLPDVHWEVHTKSEGPSTESGIIIRVKGSSEMELERLAAVAEGIGDLLKQIPGTKNVATDYRLRPEAIVTPLPQVASLFGVTNEMIVRGTQFALNGVEVTEVDFGGQEDIDLRIVNQKHHRNEIRDLKMLPIRARDGRCVSLDQVADVTLTMGPNAIRHRDQDRIIRVLADVDNKVALVDGVFATLRERLAAAQASGDPVLGAGGYTVFYGGENEERDKSMADLKRAMLVGAALILVILVIQFNSFSQPLIIMFSIPLSFVGVIYGLMVCGFNFSIAAMIGVVALVGVVVNDAIVLVDFINRLRKDGMPLEAAIIRGGQLRLRPVFLTTFTTVGGMLPMALNISGGGEFWQPPCVSILFGLMFATLLTLLVIPTAYYTQVCWLEWMVEWWRRRSGQVATEV